MKLAIVGSRKFTDYSILIKKVSAITNRFEGVTEIVSGGAKGTDTLAKRLAIERDISFKEFLPDYSKYVKYATLVRNSQIVEYSDRGIAFVEESSKGIWNTIKKFRTAGKSIELIEMSEKKQYLNPIEQNGLCAKGFEGRVT